MRALLPEEIQAARREVTALQAALAEVATEFDGEDVLRPETRQELEEAVEALKAGHALLGDMSGNFKLPSLDDREVAENLEFIRHFPERVLKRQILQNACVDSCHAAQ